ncbi:helix-turn-helix domain-containing protein [Halorubrum sp. DM2]|uniref:helix-turn-helix domain-containing protein n=1 Tax=Halorubrum sp. DM2 TaxID=2527867 RepID=UPI0024B746F8|nr:helix-turn-helix domain-containing protein [Halorubrum sp. DM2]
MMSKSHLRVISQLIDGGDPEVSISTLADQLEWSTSHASRIITELEAYGCIQTKQSGREKPVSLTEIEPIEQLEGLLTEYRHMDLPALIAGSGLQILYYLDRGRTATELAERSGVSRATVYRRLDDFQVVGVIGKSKSRYRLNEPFTVLASIARGLFHQKHRRETREHVVGLNFLWETHDEYLFACDSDINTEGFQLTGPALFGEFGVPLLTRDRRHYFRTDRVTEVDPVELVCHALLIDDGSRYRTYCLLLIQKQDIDRTALRDRAEYYHPEATIDLRDIVHDLIEYLETSGETTAEFLPNWEEFKQTAREYEVTL